MDIELDEYLLGIVEDARESQVARTMAKKLYTSWQEGYIPAPKLLRKLRRLRGDLIVVCSRLQPDGSCIWLRRHAREEGLVEPGLGEKAICKRSGTGPIDRLWKSCPGFSRQN